MARRPSAAVRRYSIGVDACAWDNRRGYGRFTRELITALVAGFSDAHDFYLVTDAGPGSLAGLPRDAKVVTARTRVRSIEAARADGSRSVFDMLRVGGAIWRLAPDVVFFPSPYTFVPVLRPTPMVMCLHDAMTERWPEMFFPTRRSRANWRAKLWLARMQADRLITPTATSARDIASAFGLDPADLTAVGEAPSAVFKPVTDQTFLDETVRRHGLRPDVPLVLYVGGISPHKNLHTLLQAFAGIEAPWQLALIGDVEGDKYLGLDEPLDAQIERLGLARKAKLTGFVPDNDLAALYTLARFVVLPSLDEGFGLPVVEAMACGTPAAVSARGALREVAGEAALYFDPERVEDMRAVCQRLLCDDATHADLAERARVRARGFKWTAVAEKTMSVLCQVAEARVR